jgi:NAD+ kinase
LNAAPQVLVVAHHERPEARELVERTVAKLEPMGYDVRLPDDDARALAIPQLGGFNQAAKTVFAISLGGDGTMLRAVQLTARDRVPVMGVNVGLLGYLAETDPEGYDAALTRVVDGHYVLEERMMLEASVGVQRFLALNEAVVEKLEPGHTVRLKVSIAGADFTTYAADGLIVATPTGSTAYSLSARGPIVSPTHRALLLTPVSPHMLFDRSLVLSPDEPVEIEVIGHRSATLSVDGQPTTTLEPGATVVCRPAEVTARFVRFGDRRFHQILKTKFGLADR